MERKADPISPDQEAKAARAAAIAFIESKWGVGAHIEAYEDGENEENEIFIQNVLTDMRPILDIYRAALFSNPA